MKAKVLLVVTQWDGCWDALAEEYHKRNLIDDVLDLARSSYPEVLRDDEEADDVEGEIQDENDSYILTWEDYIEDCMRIYEKC